MSMSLFFILLCAPALSYAHSQRAPPSPLRRRSSSVPSYGFYNPVDDGGSWFTSNTGGGGEPLNVVISAYSDGAILMNQDTNGGFITYAQSVGLSTECLGQHEGTPQTADLGDGDGWVNQSVELRWDYGDVELGTCEETIDGGEHLRNWFQNGSQHDSGAIFMAVSYEEPLVDAHTIISNGYNLGRDWFVGNATGNAINTSALTNGSVYSGSTTFGGYTFSTTATYIFGFLPNTSDGVNHNTTVATSDSNAVDGYLAVLEVKITGQPASSSALRAAQNTLTWTLPALLVIATLHPIASLSI